MGMATKKPGKRRDNIKIQKTSSGRKLCLPRLQPRKKIGIRKWNI